MENHGLLPEINTDSEHADRPYLFFKVGGNRWPVFILMNYVVRYNALQHITLGQTEHTMQSLLKCFNVWMFPHGEVSMECL